MSVFKVKRDGVPFDVVVSDEDDAYFMRYNWRVDVSGYVVRTRMKEEGERFPLLKKTIFLHREIKPCPDGKVIDHINRNRLDNRRENLRACTTSENLQNKESYTVSGFKGVYRPPGNSRWSAKVTIDRKQYHLGQYDTKEQAAKAYNEFIIKRGCNFAFLNPV